MLLWKSLHLHAEAAKDLDLPGFIDGKLAAGEKVIVVRPGNCRVTPKNREHLLLKELTGVNILARDVDNRFQVKDCKFGFNRSRGILIKASHGEVSGILIKGGRKHAIPVSPEYWWLEAGSSEAM